MYEIMPRCLQNFLDDEQRVKIWPSKKSMKIEILVYLATKIDESLFYSEKDLNHLLLQWHTFQDPALLRRELYEFKIINRSLDGRQYWKLAEK